MAFTESKITCVLIPVPEESHCAGMLPHRQAIRPGNMLTVNQEIPEDLVQADQAVLCPLLAGQMSVSSASSLFLRDLLHDLMANE